MGTIGLTFSKCDCLSLYYMRGNWSLIEGYLAVYSYKIEVYLRLLTEVFERGDISKRVVSKKCKDCTKCQEI